MKVNQFAVLPAQVRYDKKLTDKSKLLFAEISAAANAYGICDADNRYFSMCIDVDYRTVTRCLTQLMDEGHIQKVKEDGRPKIKIINRGLELPAGVEIVDMTPREISPEVQQFTLLVSEIWGKYLGMKVVKPEYYINYVNERLNEFSKEDILSAIRNRTHFLNQSAWHQEGDRWATATALDTFLNSRESILKWLNAGQRDEVELKPFE